MNNRLVILLAIAGYLGYRALQKARSVQGWKFDLAGFPKFKLFGTTVQITVPLKVSNVSDEKVTIHSLSGSVYFQNSFVGNFSTVSEVVINAASSSTFDLSVSAAASDLLNTLVAALTSKNTGSVLRVVGSAAAYGIAIPFDVSIKL